MSDAEFSLAEAVLMLAQIKESTLVAPIEVTVESAAAKKSVYQQGTDGTQILTIRARFAAPDDIAKRRLQGARMKVAQTEQYLIQAKEELKGAEAEASAEAK
ncbi:MAG: hypothetical protein WCK39_00150 [Methanomassiliicoccales archaeon]